MKLRQILWKLAYPFTMLFTRNSWRGEIMVNEQHIKPSASFYLLSTTDINGSQMNFEQLKGKQVLIVNSASHCAYTSQYRELQQLQDKFSNELVILAFPSNDFNQETDSEDMIRDFCSEKFNVLFPLMKKTSVTKKADQNPVFSWLTSDRLNGWNNKAPDWNFCKFLVNQNGTLTHYFGTAISPLDKAVVNAIKTNRAPA